MTCSPVQKQFVWVNTTAPKPQGYTGGIQSVAYVMTDKYATSLFDSCKDVEYGPQDKAITLFCGRPAKDCTLHNWLQFMGSTENGQAPFTVEYIFSNGPWISPDGEIFNPLDMENVQCNETLNTSSTILGMVFTDLNVSP